MTVVVLCHRCRKAGYVYGKAVARDSILLDDPKRDPGDLGSGPSFPVVSSGVDKSGGRATK